MSSSPANKSPRNVLNDSMQKSDRARKNSSLVIAAVVPAMLAVAAFVYLALTNEDPGKHNTVSPRANHSEVTLTGKGSFSPDSGIARQYKLVSVRKLDIKAIDGDNIEDMSSEQIQNAPVDRRREIKIVVSRDISRADLSATLRKAVDDERRKEPDVDEITVMAYGRREDASDAYTYGMVTWAPHGQWGDVTAEIAASHDRGEYKYNVSIRDKVGAPASERPSARDYALYDAVIKRLFSDGYDAFEDGEQRAIAAVAKQHGLKEQEVDAAYTKVMEYNIK